MNSAPLICHINLARGYRGGERQTELLVRALAEMGYNQRLIARKGEPLIKSLDDIPNVDLVGISKPFLLKVNQCRGADIIQVHEAKAGHLACLAHSIYGMPYVIARRVDKPPRPSLLNRRLYRNAAAVVAVSAAIASIVEDTFSSLSATVIPDAHSGLPVDSDLVKNIKKRFEGKFLIGHAGALVDRHKGQLTLVEAMHQLAERHSDIHLLLLGEGEDEARIQQAAKSLSTVHLEGFTQKLGSYLQALDLFVYPSRFEGLGSVMLDAMHAGLPVIASRVGGIPEIIEHESNGLLVPAGDAKALFAAISRLRVTDELRERLSQTARKNADDYAPEVMANRYLTLYEKILN